MMKKMLCILLAVTMAVLPVFAMAAQCAVCSGMRMCMVCAGSGYILKMEGGKSVEAPCPGEYCQNGACAACSPAPAALVAAENKLVEQQGFQSTVRAYVGLTEDGRIASIRLDTRGETAGFGTRCMEDAAFINQFIGQTIPVQADVLSGATVTSNAVIAAVNSLTPMPEGDVLTAKAVGFQSAITVSVTLDDARRISFIEVDASGETNGFGMRCGVDQTFLSQFIGQTIPVQADVLSGATVTSNAIIAAVNSITPPAGRTLTGSAKGFSSNVTVKVDLDDEDRIIGIRVDASGETQGIGTRCAEDEAWQARFIGSTIPVQVDVLSGATVTSNAVMAAINSLELQLTDRTLTAGAWGFQSDVWVAVTLDENNRITGIDVDAIGETRGIGMVCAEDEEWLGQFNGLALPVQVDVLSGATETSKAIISAVNSLADVDNERVHYVTAPGFSSDVGVKVVLDDDGRIIALAIDTSGETEGVGSCCTIDLEWQKRFLGQTLPVEVDAISGVTVTSNAVVNAINTLAPAAVETETYAACMWGYQSDVWATVTLDEAGRITDISVNADGETPDFGSACEDGEWLSQFIGQTIPVQTDVISGATETSQAVIAAVNIHAPMGAENVHFVTRPGFSSDVGVKVVLDDDGRISSLWIDAGGETQGIGSLCTEDKAWQKQFIGQTLPVEADVLSGATITSIAVIDAVNSLAPEEGVKLTGTAQGFQSEVMATVTLNDEGVIIGLGVDTSGETFGIDVILEKNPDFMYEFHGQTLPVQVDTVAGATVTSGAVIAAVNSAAEQPAQPEGEKETGTAQGFQSEVRVKIVLDELGKIIQIEADTSGETFGMDVILKSNPDFLIAFLGQTLPVEVDTVAGATVTSGAVIAAVNSLAPEQADQPAQPEGETLTGSAKGFSSDVTATVTLDADGRIIAIEVDTSGETQGIGTLYMNNQGFADQFIGQMIPVQADVIAGATVTGRAVEAAVNSLADESVALPEALPAKPKNAHPANPSAGPGVIPMPEKADTAVPAGELQKEKPKENETPNAAL